MTGNSSVSNYEQMKKSMASVFLQCDQNRMIQRFALQHDHTYLYIYFMGRDYRINRSTGRINWSKDFFLTEEPAGYNEVMTIYDVLTYSEEPCCLAHEWINIDSLSPIQNGSIRRGNSLFHSFEEYFDGKVDSLSSACQALGGRQIGRGDVAYELDLFTFLPLTLRFWQSDEDFPASLQILVDKNTLRYMRYETLMFAATHLLHLLKSFIQANSGSDFPGA